MEYGQYRHDWVKELKIRQRATIGDRYYFGATNCGRDELFLPVVKITPTQLTCSDGDKTRRIMIFSGKVVGHILSGAKFVGGKLPTNTNE